ncbi:hypothetical protein [Bartonella grahamii]|uniref:hypothetical protein n=1 Tax=Bartonella grahamii TaxID=33045 RepID=UPI002E7C0D79|nr:hypothetical protein [Bartonella grahamii]
MFDFKNCAHGHSLYYCCFSPDVEGSIFAVLAVRSDSEIPWCYRAIGGAYGAMEHWGGRYGLPVYFEGFFATLGLPIVAKLLGLPNGLGSHSNLLKRLR